jgi:dihydrofolate reductase
MAKFFDRIDAAAMGRKTYEEALKLGGPMGGGGMASYVFSKSLPAGERNGIVFTRESPKAFVERLRKNKKGKDIWLMGGGELAAAFLNAGLVDELYLGIVPVLLGEGIPLFPPGFKEQKFKLAANNTYSRGLIELLYTRVNGSGSRS